MRIRYIVLSAVIALCAGGGVYVFTSETCRHRLSAARELVPESVIALIRGHKSTGGPGKANAIKRAGHSPMENNILNRLAFLEIADSSVSFRRIPDSAAVEIRAAVPRGKPVEWIIWHLSSASSGTSYRVEDCSCPADDRGCVIRFQSSEPHQPDIHLSVSWASRYFSATAKMAVLIRDFGFAADQKTIEYLSFPEPLTVALLPSRKLASWTSRISREYKKEIIILQPMEPCLVPRASDGQKPQCIMLHYPESRVRSIIAGAAEAVPDFAGFSNLGGTRALEDSRLTGILFSEIKKRHGYFIEDQATRKSVASAVADRLSLPFGTIGRSVDSAMDVSHAEELIRSCAMEAQKRGYVIISSKASVSFIRALKKQLPVLRQNGIKLSYVSEIVTPDKKGK